MRKLDRNGKIIVISLSVLLSVTIPIASLLWSEGAFTSRKKTWDVLQSALISLMGEYPDRPNTFIGQVSQLILLGFGNLALGAIIGSISSFLITRAIRRQKIMKPFNDHIIICNWNDKAPFIVRQLLEGNQNHPREIVIISAEEITERDDLADRTDVYFIRADPTHHATLEKLQAHRAKSIILLADRDTEGPDEKNALIALAIKHLESTPDRPRDIHVVGELVRLDRYRHLKEAGVDELISARDYSSGIIAQSALFKNMSVVYQQLLTYTDDTNEFYFIPPGKYPKHFIGKTFRELRAKIDEYSDTDEDRPVILLGIKRGNGEILLNPKRSRFDRLAASDSLIVMAFHNIDRIVE
ncbi:NAD-binding protein [Pannus brasiliensis CCIBt3594]|uniref:NAD-binding protein n=1 Tax=Pannus brasiliensis CCIBt3594 TaxID=1427578 RepID=A0AAW9QRV9_9CHRO